MRRRAPDLLPRHDFPYDDSWRLVERRFAEERMAQTETLFSVGNGYLGLRGNYDEGRPSHEHSTLIAGFHETWPIAHAEEAFGLAQTGQTIVDVPDTKMIQLYVDDEPLFLPTAPMSGYERVLDFRAGTLSRRLVWETQSGKRVEVRSRRLTSLRQRHLAAYEFEVRMLEGSAPVAITSRVLNRHDVEGRPANGDPRVRTVDRKVLHNVLHRAEGERLLFGYRTGRSGMTLGCGVDHVMETAGDYQVRSECSEDMGEVTYIVEAEPGVPIRLVKFAAYHTSRSVAPEELVDRATRVLWRAVSTGFDEIVASQRASLDDFWERSDVQVDGDACVQQAVRWNLFQLCQATARAEGSGVPAKGLTGTGYEGHYFWDIETFVLPFLCYTEPRIAKNLVRFRHRMLGKARERASELNVAGALFPWRTINGEEASAYYQAGTAQYHLDADIAYALKRYVDVTGDRRALLEEGVELLVGTARMWADLGFYDGAGRFHLFTVTGPDEYTTVVNDNAYTNLMARLNLNYAASVIEELRDADPDRYAVLCHEVGLDDGEVAEWWRAAKAMHVPYDDQRGINPQDAQFLEREVWDFENTPEERYPLLLHYHPLVIYRHQVIKQADVVLAMFLLGNEFGLEQKRRNFDYYDPLTTSDSSLSPPVHSIVAAEVGDAKRAMEHFRLALFMDLADVAHNTGQGVHIASTAGVWMALVYGFGGLRDYDGEICFDPKLPKGWDRLRFPLRVRDRRIDVEITHEQVSLALGFGDDLVVRVRGEVVELTAGETYWWRRRGMTDLDGYDAVLLDLDGVITSTADQHFQAWKQMFDEFLTSRKGGTFERADYNEHVDGVPRFDGVRNFLRSRDIGLEEGSLGDGPEQQTVHGLGNRKNGLVNRMIEEQGVTAYDGTVRLLRQLRDRGTRCAVVSSSRNARLVLEVAGLTEMFDTRVDGEVASERGLAGKPAPDTFLAAAEALGVAPARAVVIEDALAGVDAGRAGGFGLVVGVDRVGQREALLRHGADVVVDDLAELVRVGG